MGRPLGGWSKLNRTTGCWWWFREFATLLRREAFHADEWLEVFCGNLLVKACYSLNVEAHRVLFLGLFKCAIFWSPLDEKFFDVCEASVVFNLSRVCACEDFDDGRILARGVTAPEGFRGWSLFPFGGLGVFRSFVPSLFKV